METTRPLREVPNWQVLDAAKAFDDAYAALWKLAPGSGVVLPALHCACIAMELYLKTVSAVEVEIPDAAFPGAYYIYARASTPSHVLADLLRAAPSDFRGSVDSIAHADPRLRSYATFADALDALDGLFFSSRYPFEPNSDISKVPTHAIQGVLNTLRSAVDSIPHRLEPVPPSGTRSN